MGLSSKLRMDQLKLSFTSPPCNTFLKGQAWKLKCSRFFFYLRRGGEILLVVLGKMLNAGHRITVVGFHRIPPLDRRSKLHWNQKYKTSKELQMQSSVIVVIGVSNSLVYMTSSPKPQLFKSERCETQSHIVHWLSSSIFTCLFVCLVVRLHGDISIHLHLVMF